MARHQGDNGETRPKREGSGVAHEDHRRMGVVPKETKVRACDDQRERRNEVLTLNEGDDAVGHERE